MVAAAMLVASAAAVKLHGLKKPIGGGILGMCPRQVSRELWVGLAPVCQRLKNLLTRLCLSMDDIDQFIELQRRLLHPKPLPCMRETWQ